MVVTLSIIALLAVLVTTQFSGDSAKATKILSDLVVIKKSILQYQMDNGKYPHSFYNLLNSSNLPAHSDKSTWGGPYLEKIDYFAGSSQLMKVNGIDGAYIAMTAVPIGHLGSVGPPGYTQSVILHVFDIPRGVAAELMKKCVGDEMLMDFSKGICARGANGGGGPEFVSYYVGLKR